MFWLNKFQSTTTAQQSETFIFKRPCVSDDPSAARPLTSLSLVGSRAEGQAETKVFFGASWGPSCFILSCLVWPRCLDQPPTSKKTLDSKCKMWAWIRLNQTSIMFWWSKKQSTATKQQSETFIFKRPSETKVFFGASWGSSCFILSCLVWPRCLDQPPAPKKTLDSKCK